MSWPKSGLKGGFKIALLALILAGAASAELAWADRGRVHSHARVAVFVNPWPLFFPYPYAYPGPYYYPYAYPYPNYPAVVVTPATPSYYIEQGMETAPANPSGTGSGGQTNDWYYCRNPEGYYPYVKACPSGWQRVSPTPPK